MEISQLLWSKAWQSPPWNFSSSYLIRISLAATCSLPLLSTCTFDATTVLAQCSTEWMLQRRKHCCMLFMRIFRSSSIKLLSIESGPQLFCCTWFLYLTSSLGLHIWFSWTSWDSCQLICPTCESSSEQQSDSLRTSTIFPNLVSSAKFLKLAQSHSPGH